MLENGFYVRHDSDVLGLLRKYFPALLLMCVLLEMEWDGSGGEYAGL